VSTDSSTDGSDNPFRNYIRSLLKPFTDKSLEVKLVLVEANGRHYVSVAKRFDAEIDGLFELDLAPIPERHYRGIERIYGDSVFVAEEKLELHDRRKIRVNIVGKTLTRLTREQADYLYNKGL
jgi:hypothetical protein